MKLIDTHCHLDEIENLDSVLDEARETRVTGIIAVGINYQTNLKVLELAESYPEMVFPALGLHPQELPEMDDVEIDRTLSQIEEHIDKAVAIGEIGLDYHKRIRALVSKERQQSVLRDVVLLAKKFEKPVSIHSRYAWKDALTIATEVGIKDAVFHWYTGPSSVLRDLLEQGYYISATPAAEYHSEHRRAIREAPLNRLFLETDSPVSYGREDRYTAAPRDVVRSLNAASEITGMNRESLAEQTTRNAIRFFRLPVSM
ncbi:MAG: TatD family hydrolase [Dehalococcoidales bacterium]|nr:MAG: TatD family hydrolase [Dehalococcoidales bacterium]